ncbi:class I SAM-dependent methyltransferase [Streptomyces sp. MBT65]|uniref:class I SAM-dependent methyltransferase n=1 Tax=Streptomyces sp. MBT65 TaxID=1488395 RepID=UPI0019095D82|nr:class I SAM-dependent methyltransferase [Streptomyces sp. MBT65]MBK3573483.1 class I SAM-dependent methyltransferase [Streptomyces sp. MBT65]
MTTDGRRTPYWDAVAATKTFTHPLHLPWLEGIDRHAAILDYGCGYGRIMKELEQHGFADLTGVDISPAMIERAQHLYPALHFATLDTPPALPSPPAAFDAVLLFAVLTCIPADDAQRRLITELNRLLKPGGILYISDLLLQDDDRNRRRYDRCMALRDTSGRYGVLETDDGAVCRHHSRDWLTTLLGAFEAVATRTITVPTMNGHEATGIQLLVRKPVAP